MRVGHEVRTGEVVSSHGIRGKLLRRVVPLVVAPVLLLGAIALIGIVALRSDVDDAFERTSDALAAGGDAAAVQDGLDEIDDAVDTGRTRLALAVVATLVVATVAAVIGVTLVARRLVGPIRELALAARRAADERLPEAVAAADGLDPGQLPPTPDPIVMDTGDELDDLASAVNTLQATAVDLAVGEALARRQRTALFLNLGRRNQNLVSKQIEHLDEMEREETDPTTLDGLLRLDHLATRMRRNAENLLVFAGLDSPRRWSDPVPMRDVIRAAAAEIRDYERVELADVDDVQVDGDVASDVVHLLAELLENAASFSGPGTDVEVFGRWRGSTYSVSVVDHGLGMTPERLSEVNHRLSHPDSVGDVSGTYMGLFVVAKLAARHGMAVRLIESPFEGTTAKLTVPESLLVGEPPSDAEVQAAEDDDRPLEPAPPVSIRDRDPGRSRSASTAPAPPGDSRAVPARGPLAARLAAASTEPADAADVPDEVTPSGFHRRRPGRSAVNAAATPVAAGHEAADRPHPDDGGSDGSVEEPVAIDGEAADRAPTGDDATGGPDVTPSGFVRRRPGLVTDAPAASTGGDGAAPDTDVGAEVGPDPTRRSDAAQRRRSRFGSLQAGIETGRAARPGAGDADDGPVDGDTADRNDGEAELGLDESAFGSRRWWES